jgi:MYXO-CTERM domain-containing protein
MAYLPCSTRLVLAALLTLGVGACSEPPNGVTGQASGAGGGEGAPEAIASLMRRVPSEAVETETGFLVRSGAEAVSPRAAIQVELDKTDASLVLRGSLDGFPLRARRIGGRAPDRAQIERGVVELDGVAPGLDARVFSRPTGIEDLLVVHEPEAPLGYELELPARWAIAQDAAQVVEVVDPEGSPRFKVVAAGAWDARGRSLPVALHLEGVARVVVDVDAEGATYPLYVDPELKVGGALAFDRWLHTVTSTLEGRALVIGGPAYTPESFPYCAPTPIPVEVFDVRTMRFDVLSDAPAPRCEHSATLLRSGQVLLVGGRVWIDGAVETMELVEVLDPKTAEVQATAQLATARANHTATRLRDGRVLIVGGEQLADDGSPIPLDTTELWEPASGGLVAGPALGVARTQHTATLLPDGRVLVAGGQESDDVSRSAEIFDPETDTWTFVADPMATERRLHSATATHAGEVVLWGGSSATTGSLVQERFDPLTLQFTSQGDVEYVGARPLFFPQPHSEELVRGATGASKPTDARAVLLPFGRVFTLELGNVGAIAELSDASEVFATQLRGLDHDRGDHTATVLPSGRLLLAGGRYVVENNIVETFPQGLVEELDPITGVSTVVGSMARLRYDHAATLLRDGRVLIVGGGSDTGGDNRVAEIYDPATQTFEDTDRIQIDRSPPTATLLPNGDVLIAGGTDDPLLERYVTASGTFEAAGELVQARRFHTATRLLDGRVLIAGGGTALLETYDPRTGALATAGTMKQVRSGHAAALLPDGSVLLVGGIANPASPWTGANAEIWDPATETSREPLEPLNPSFPIGPGAQAVGLPSGEVLVCAPGYSTDGSGCGLYRLTLDAFRPIPYPASNYALYYRPGGSLTRALDGSVVYAGFYEGVIAIQNTYTRLRPRPPVAAAPRLTAYPAPIPAGSMTPVVGEDLVARTEATNGTSFGSAADHPIAVWMPAAEGTPSIGTVTEFAPESATWTVPQTQFPGLGSLFLSTVGAVGVGAPVTVLGARVGTPCAAPEACASGHCADGVCCDEACGGCDACAAQKKGSGEDGVCGPLPAGAPPASADACPAQPLSECGRTGVCDGAGSCAVVADGTPCVDGASCSGGSCLATPLSCEGEHLVAEGEVVVDCEPYRCTSEGPACLQDCRSTLDCASGHVCSVEGVCEPSQTAPPSADSGCAVGGPAPSHWLAALASAALLARRRRRREVAAGALLGLAVLSAGCDPEPQPPPPEGGGGQTAGTGGAPLGGGGEGGVPAVPSTCGNGVREGAEACDGADLGEATCEGLGFDSGTPDCRYDCTLDPTTCVGCGNGYLDPGEECDSDQLAGETCVTLAPPSWWSFISQWFEEYAEHESHVSGALSCDAQCRLDTSTCGYCFDGVLNGDELCDDGDFVNGPAPPILQGATCETVAPGVYTGGELFCGFCFGPTAYWTEYCERPPVPPCVAGENCSFVLGRTVTPAELAAEEGLGLASGSLTVEGWFRVDAWTQCRLGISRWTFGEPESSEWGFLSELDLVWVRARNQAEPPAALWSQANAYNALPLGEWVHLAGVFDLEQAELRLYAGGALRDTAPLELGSVTPSLPMLLTQPCWDAFEPWGRMDEVRISSVVRYSGDFVPEPTFTPDSDTLALYHFDEGDGLVALDASGHGRHVPLSPNQTGDGGPSWAGEHP